MIYFIIRKFKIEDSSYQPEYRVEKFTNSLDEAIELSTELGLNITDAEIIRTNSTGFDIYNPKNLADRIKGMKNKRVKTKAEKIAERLLYEQQSTVAN